MFLPFKTYDSLCAWVGSHTTVITSFSIFTTPAPHFSSSLSVWMLPSFSSAIIGACPGKNSMSPVAEGNWNRSTSPSYFVPVGVMICKCITLNSSALTPP